MASIFSARVLILAVTPPPLATAGGAIERPGTGGLLGQKPRRLLRSRARQPQDLQRPGEGLAGALRQRLAHPEGDHMHAPPDLGAEGAQRLTRPPAAAHLDPAIHLAQRPTGIHCTCEAPEECHVVRVHQRDLSQKALPLRVNLHLPIGPPSGHVCIIARQGPSLLARFCWRIYRLWGYDCLQANSGVVFHRAQTPSKCEK
mmetsp:Transcript_110085/g.306750  ORF Transcript_110085/g.306750 Transcript_110085/m.306750 type:complete len:201 (+) Transcript_110085:26-628(+)